MRVFNLTDISTENLRSIGLSDVSITLGGVVIAPGGSGVVKNNVKHEVNTFVSQGALAIDEVPQWYASVKKSIADCIVVTETLPVDTTQVDVEQSDLSNKPSAKTKKKKSRKANK